MPETHPEVDDYLEHTTSWPEISAELRRIALDCGLTEDFKWNKPCYAYDGGNVAIIQGFKDCCALMFFKGALLDAPEDVLKKPGPNSRVGRRLEFSSVDEVIELEPVLRDCIAQAIEAEKKGLEVELEDRPEPIPDELQAKFDENPELEAAFEELTPGRQRGYILYFSGAKQSATRTRRIEKYEEKILEGKGMRD